MEFTNTGNVSPDEGAQRAFVGLAGQQERFAREGAAALGGAISRVGGQLGERADQAIASQWLGHGSAISTQLLAELTQQWNETAAKSDPNDTSIGAGFREKAIEPSLGKFQEQFANAPQSVQKWALATTDHLRQHFATKIAADEGIRAGVAVGKNIQDTYRNLSTTVGNDPSALPDAVAMLDANARAFIASHPNLTAAESAKLNEELPKLKSALAKSAFDGMVDKNPSAAINLLARGDFNEYWDKPQQEQMKRYAETVQRQQRVDQEHQQEIARRDKAEAQKLVEDKYVQNVLTGKSIKGYETDPNIGPAERMRITSFQHAHTMQMREKKDTQPHPEQFRGLLNDMFDKARADPNNLSVQPIRDAFKKGLLNPREEAELEQRFNALDKPMERNFHAQVQRVDASVKASIYGQTISIGDPGAVPALVTRMEKDAYDKLTAARDKGDAAAVNAMLDPTNSQYVFSPSVVNSYLTPPKQNVAATADKVRAGERAPGDVRQIGGAATLQPQPAAAPAPAIAYLKAHPETKDQFKAKYGYLPE